MNHIPELQNSPEFIRLLRARSQLYKEAVRAQVLQLILTVVIPVAGAFFGLVNVEVRPFVAIVAFAVTILDVSFIDRIQRDKLKAAAKISEQFDCGLLSLPWNQFVVGKKLDPEFVEAAAARWISTGKLFNWYPPAVGRAPLRIARIICQRSNLWFDSELRRRYGGYLLIFALCMSLTLVAIGFYRNLTMTDFATIVCAPLAPILIWAIRDRFRQNDAADALVNLKDAAESLLTALTDQTLHSEEEFVVGSRELQDAIFARRVANPLLFPLIYRLSRSAMDEQMNYGAEELLRKAGLE